ncbi:MAG: DNA cytosine methyltransferase, partial [Clostridia bacterium]|nr:DNA cytosine methyltransferase [Clostridia bacterium]
MKQLSVFDTDLENDQGEKDADNSLKILSLFSGCGGMDIGFEGEFTCLKRSVNAKLHPDWITEDQGDYVKLAPTGFKTVFANDIKEDAKAAWVSYFEKRNSNARDIYHVESIVNAVKRARSGEKVFPDGIDIVTWGFPCQDFSVSGTRQGFHSQTSHDGTKISPEEPSVENRGQLYIWMRDVISLTQPKLFVAENVKGLISLEDAKEIIESDFSNAANGGYLVVPAKVLCAADYGVPQSRERVIFFGFKRSALQTEALEALSNSIIPAEYDPYPPRTHSNDDETLEKYVTCRETLA